MIHTGLIKLERGERGVGGQFNSYVVKDTPELLVDRLVPVVLLGPAVPEKRKVIRNCFGMARRVQGVLQRPTYSFPFVSFATLLSRFSLFSL